MEHLPPVITFDGPSGSGKGTIAKKLAMYLGWHYLDSGAYYRAVAWAVTRDKVSIEKHSGLKTYLNQIKIRSQWPGDEQDIQIFVNDNEISQYIRDEQCGAVASKIAAVPLVRKKLLKYQHEKRQFPGLVTDGRDMGSVVFPDAQLKFYLIAESGERAKRRQHQLQEQGINVSLREVQEELTMRDKRDANRNISPAKPAPDVINVDTTGLGIQAVYTIVLGYVKEYV